jgi:hypothetical protein
MMVLEESAFRYLAAIAVSKQSRVFQDALINLGNVLQLLIKMSIRNGAVSGTGEGVLLSSDVKLCCTMFLDVLKRRVDGSL